MRLTDHVTLNFNNNMSTAAVFLDIEKAFDTSGYWVGFLAGIIKLISSFLQTENSESRLKARCLRQEKYKQECHKVPSCPQPSTVYIYIYIYTHTHRYDAPRAQVFA
jgi:hypothetical protein